MPLPEEIVRPRRRILELQRTVVVLPVLANRLEEHQRVPRPIAELVLRQIRGDGVDPGRKLLRTIEAVEVPIHPDEYLLHEVLSLLAIPDRTEHKVQQAGLIPLDQLLERTLIAA